MKLFSKAELKHLKYKLINERGMNPDEAEAHIRELLNETKRTHQLAKANKKSYQNASKPFKEAFTEMTRGKKDD